MKNYNPYELLQVYINGQSMTGRPIAFDSEVTNQKTMKNYFGGYVKPTKLSTMCPECGQGFELDITLEGDPPFEPLACDCPNCRPEPPPTENPFVNPIETGRIPATDLDPLLADGQKPLDVSMPAETTLLAPVELDADLMAELRPEPQPKKTQKKKAPNKLIEKAEGLTEEEEFDDGDLVDE